MNRHASINRVYRLIWSEASDAWVPVAETAKGRGKSGRSRSFANRNGLAAAISLALSPLAHAAPPAAPCVAPACAAPAVSATSHPLGAQVVSGTASITQSGNTTDIRQSSNNLSIDWLSFNVGSQASVDFIQPSASAVAVNRISGTNGSEILGHIDANGQVWLINPNGVLFGPGSVVDVGGLVASTLEVTGSGINGNSAVFTGNGTGSVINQGTIIASNGGYVALLGNHVSNQGVISAQLGTVALGAGSAATLTFAGNSLVKMQVDRSTLDDLAANGGLIQADGGQVLMSAGARAALLASVVNNSGVIEARTVQNHDGTISLIGGMAAGTVNVGGTLDASAPNGGSGGFIETNAAHVEVANDAKVTTAAAKGLTGSWLIDPTDYTVAAAGGDISGATLSGNLNTTSVTILSSNGTSAVTGGGSGGNINLNDALAWSGNTTLTLTAANNVNVNANITASGAAAALAINPNTSNGSQTFSGTGTLSVAPNTAVTLSGANASLSIATGAYTLGAGATINLPKVSPASATAFVLGGIPYTVINRLGSPGSTTGTDLQGINGNLAGHYALGGNINASATSTWNSNGATPPVYAGFTPIGNSTTPFTGIFDGLGHTISSLYINLPSGNDAGLFGYAGTGSVIQSMNLVGGSVSGSNYVGGLVGRTYGGTISNSSATGSVSGSNYVGGLVGRTYGGTISNSSATGSVSGSNYVGGLVGRTHGGTISNSSATGSVSGTSGPSSTGTVGGLVGYNYFGTISNSYATGSVSGGLNVGGLVGRTYAGTISNSYATGNVAGYLWVGGLVGGNNSGTISNSYAIGSVSGSNYVGGLVGRTAGGAVSNSYWDITTSGRYASSGGTPLTTAQMQSASNFAGFTFTTTPGATGNNWVIVDTDGSLNNAGSVAGAAFPMLASEYSTTINNAHQLQLMVMKLSASYTLGQNINASGTNTALSFTDVWSTSGGFIPIGNSSSPFTGTFNGLGHTISNLTINLPSTNYVGLFGYSSGTIRNIGIVGGSVSGARYVGGLVGSTNYSAISTSYTTGSVSGSSYVGGLVGSNAKGSGITGSFATGTVTGTSNSVGGLAGSSSAPISSSYATGQVTGASFGAGGLVGYNTAAITNSYATGAVSSTGNSDGGLVGLNTGPISVSYATGAVNGVGVVGGLAGYTSGAVSDSYSAGKVTGTAAVGGLVGSIGGGTMVTASFWDTTTSGQSTSAGGTGLTTAQMQTQANFTSATAANGNVNPNWDFAGTWVMYNGHTYPLLRTFMTPITLTPVYNGTAQTLSNISNYTSNIANPIAADLINTSAGLTLFSSATAGKETAVLNGFFSNQQGYIISYAPRIITGTGSAANGLTIANPISWGAGKLTLSAVGNIAINANLDGTGTASLAAIAKGGAITQGPSTAIEVAGATTLTADNGVSGAGDVKYDITLASTTNNFTGSLSSNGLNIDLSDGTGGLILGATTATGTLTVDSLGGAITQTAGKAVNVAGASTLTTNNGAAVNYAITLGQAGNNFGGTVTAEGSAITLKDSGALTAVLDSSGASTLTSVGNLEVSGTVGTRLKTTTTGATATTTFGATTVGSSTTGSLVVSSANTSANAVTETSPDILQVHGEGTTTIANPYVTVNGIVGAEIP